MSQKTDRLLRRFARASGIDERVVRDRYERLNPRERADALAISRKYIETKDKVAQNVREARGNSAPALLQPERRADGPEGTQESSRGSGSQPVPPHDDPATA